MDFTTDLSWSLIAEATRHPEFSRRTSSNFFPFFFSSFPRWTYGPRVFFKGKEDKTASSMGSCISTLLDIWLFSPRTVTNDWHTLTIFSQFKLNSISKLLSINSPLLNCFQIKLKLSWKMYQFVNALDRVFRPIIPDRASWTFSCRNVLFDLKRALSTYLHMIMVYNLWFP